MKVSNPDRFRKDESGQWWYLHSKKRQSWIRTYPRVCPTCSDEFVPAYRSKLQTTTHCSRGCGNRALNKRCPGKFAREKAGRWKGGRRVTKRGYVTVHCPGHPSIKYGKRIYVLEHRLVMERLLGRYLEPHEQVHHKNGIRDDNRPENLELWVKQQPPGQRVNEFKSPDGYGWSGNINGFIAASLASCG